MESKKIWYAVYTKPRWEKKVHATMTSRGLESYCPLNKVRKQWSDRVKLVEEPLFKSYVFVHVAEEEQTRVRMVDGVLNYVYWQGKPAVIKDKEIDTVLSLLPKEAVYYFTRAQIPRALPEKDLQQKAMDHHLTGKTFSDVNAALNNAKQHSSADDLILVCGSVFLVGEVDQPV